MGERLSLFFPFILAVLFPPVGVLLGAIEWPKDRELGMRLIAVSLLAAVVWFLLFVV
ncbi:MAG TPA: hypothetical protein VFI03_05155 [Solirubrobacterales bacterium]|nr:hypothetical protein [Solirubrobacterales bacterium]